MGHDRLVNAAQLFFKVTGIDSQNEKSRKIFDRHVIHSETTTFKNNSTVTQKIQTASQSLTRTYSKSVEISNTLELGREIALAGELGIAFVQIASGKISGDAKKTKSNSEEIKNGSTFGDETEITIPSQTVEAPPRTAILASWTFYTTADVITYSVDFEIDARVSRMAFAYIEHYLSRNSLAIGQNRLNSIDFNMTYPTTCTEFRSICCQTRNDQANDDDIQIVRKGDKFVLKNMIARVTSTHFHGDFHAAEVPL